MTESMEQGFSVHVENLTPNEVMQSMRRMMVKPYLILWAAVYAAVLVIYLIRQTATFFTLFGPAIILILLALAYEFSGRKNFKPMKYDEAVLDYRFTPQGYTLTVGEQSMDFSWTKAWLRQTRSTFLLYSDKRNSSILPKRCLTDAQRTLLLSWAKQNSEK